MMLKYIFFGTLVLGLSACNAFESSKKKESDLSGQVSKVMNFMNPLPSAYAADSICTPVSGNNKVKVYLIDPVTKSKELICQTHLNSDNSFKASIRDDLMPRNRHLKIEVTLNGGVVREAIVHKDDKQNVGVNPLSTIAAPLALEDLKNNTAKPRETLTKVQSLIVAIPSINLASIPAEKVALLQSIFNASASKVAEVLHSEANREQDLKNFLSARYSMNVTVTPQGQVSSGDATKILNFE